MVQKKGKHGIRTGNTIRAINSKHIRKYRKEACIVRRDTAVKPKSHTEVSHDVFEGANIPCEDVLFSLNKNQRWLLPELIKEAFYQDDLNDTNAIFDQCPDGLELVERSKLRRNNNCRCIYASKSKSKRDKKNNGKLVIFKQSGYIDADNVLKTAAVFSRHTARLQFLREYHSIEDNELEIRALDKKSSFVEKEPETDEDDENCTTQSAPVRLEVLYPCELSSVLSLKPKILGNDTKKKFKCRNDIRRPWTLEGYRFRKRPQKGKRERIYEVITEGLDDFYFEQDVQQKENWETYYSASYINNSIEGKGRIHEKVRTETSNRVRLHTGYVKPAKKVSKKNVNEVRTDSKKSIEDTKEQIGDANDVMLNELVPTLCSEEFELDNYFDAFSANSTSIPVSVLLKKGETEVGALSDHYGDDYLECHCIPRRFVISISEYITDLDLDGIGSAYKLLPILNKKTFSWLIFVHDPVNKLNSLIENVYNVSLNSHFREIITDVRIEGLEEHSVVSITEIIGQTLKYLKDLPRESLIFEKKSSAQSSARVTNTYSLLDKMKTWNTCTYIPDNDYVIKKLISSKPAVTALHGTDKNMVIQGKPITNRNKICTICHMKTKVALALLSCCHYFCNRCWKTNIQTKVSIGCDIIRCPEFNCHEMVDTGTIISFLNVKDILTYAKRRHNMDVEKNRLAKWCSNENCGRVLLVNRLDAKTARCICGETMCFQCTGKVHWPLPCKKYLDFVEILIETRDKNIIPHDFVLKFDIKYCRICFKILIRYDKCHVESCSCDGNLCLRCSFLWHINDSTFELQTNETPSRPVSIAPSDFDQQSHGHVFSDGKRTKWYKLAMKHRLQQHPFRLAKLQASSKLLANRIGLYILREEKKCHFVTLDFTANEDSYLGETDKVTHYMTQIVNMYGEISNIVESCAFCLDKENDFNGSSESLHRRAMILSTCAKTICDLIKDGAFLNPKIVIERLKNTCSEIRRVMESIVKDF